MKKNLLLSLGFLSVFLAGLYLGFHMSDFRQWFSAENVAYEKEPTKTEMERCFDKEIGRLNALPLQTTLIALDGRVVDLEAFQILPAKFYHWKNEARTVATRVGTHRVRIYWSVAATCDASFSSKHEHGAIYGDVAEIYDTRGKFRGFAVYTGKGDQYFFSYR